MFFFFFVFFRLLDLRKCSFVSGSVLLHSLYSPHCSVTTSSHPSFTRNPPITFQMTRNFKITFALFHLLCVTELLAIVLARPTPVSSALRLEKTSLQSPSSSSSSASARRRRLLKAGAVGGDEPHGGDEAVVVAAAKLTKSAAAEVTLNAFDLCLCGAFATAFGDFVMHPVDTIKVDPLPTTGQVGNRVCPFYLKTTPFCLTPRSPNKPPRWPWTSSRRPGTSSPRAACSASTPASCPT